jgi:hypothetical protein
MWSKIDSALNKKILIPEKRFITFYSFFEDLLITKMLLENYKNLLFKPAALTKEYPLGKRLSYLALVRLYILLVLSLFY